jgi:hypothetical protein
MLILDCGNPDFTASSEAVSDWPGRRCLLLRKGVSLPAAARADDLIFEFISEVPCALVALRGLLITLERRAARPREALVFLGTQAAPDFCVRLAADIPPPPWEIAWTLEEETGELATLVLGEEVVRHPLFCTYFRNIAPALPTVHTGPSLDLMTTHLVAQ